MLSLPIACAIDLQEWSKLYYLQNAQGLRELLDTCVISYLFTMVSTCELTICTESSQEFASCLTKGCLMMVTPTVLLQNELSSKYAPACL